MKSPTRIIGLILIHFSAILLLFPAECNAQTKKMTARELTLESTSIFYGKCARVESAWTEKKDMIFTTVTLIPENYLKGNLGNEVTVTIPGGQVDDIIYEVSEMPAFRPGEEVVAFIWEHPSGKKLVTGGFQGKMKIERDPKTGKRMVSERYLGTSTPDQDVKKSASTLPEGKKLLLEDFTQEVKGYLK
jgi:hypothetical protein